MKVKFAELSSQVSIPEIFKLGSWNQPVKDIVIGFRTIMPHQISQSCQISIGMTQLTTETTICELHGKLMYSLAGLCLSARGRPPQ